MTPLTPFRINTSKKSRHFCIAFILNDFKSTRINTSAISRFNPSRINTSKKQGGTHAFFPIVSHEAFWKPLEYRHNARFPSANARVSPSCRRTRFHRHPISRGHRPAPRPASHRRFLETASGIC